MPRRFWPLIRRAIGGAFDIDAGGSHSNRRVWADLETGAPDGICVALHKKSARAQAPLLSRGGESRGEASTGVVLAKKINLLTNTTPALRATPPRLRRGICSSHSTLCAKPSLAKEGCLSRPRRFIRAVLWTLRLARSTLMMQITTEAACVDNQSPCLSRRHPSVLSIGSRFTAALS